MESAHFMMMSGLVLGLAWSVHSAMPWLGVIFVRDSHRIPSRIPMLDDRELEVALPHQLYTAGSSPFGYIQLRMLVKITESSCYLKHKNYSVSAAMTKAEDGSGGKPQ